MRTTENAAAGGRDDFMPGNPAKRIIGPEEEKAARYHAPLPPKPKRRAKRLEPPITVESVRADIQRRKAELEPGLPRVRAPARGTQAPAEDQVANPNQKVRDMSKKDTKKADLGRAEATWNTVKYEALSRPQIDALQMARAAHDGNVRWGAVKLVSGSVELTLHYIDGEARECMAQDPGTTYARRVVIEESGDVRIKELVSL